MPGCPALPALSQWALLAQWRVCGGVSEVLFSVFSFLDLHMNMHHHNTSVIPHSFRRGFPQGGVCQPCAPECASCQGNSSYCLSCETDYLLLDHSCRSHCVAGYYAIETECHHCPAHCRECNQDGLCESKYIGRERGDVERRIKERCCFERTWFRFEAAEYRRTKLRS